MKALIQTGSSLSACGHAQAGGRVPVPPEKRFLINPEVFNFHIPYGQPAIDLVAENFRARLREKPKLDFTAIIACSDPGAMALLRVFHEFGINVPEDCSVAGFDDELFANYLTPSLTNLCWHMENWGEKCLQVLERVYERKNSEPYEIKIQPSLNRRESTAPPAGRKAARKRPAVG